MASLALQFAKHLEDIVDIEGKNFGGWPTTPISSRQTSRVRPVPVAVVPIALQGNCLG